MPSKILLVDDDKDFRVELKECLSGYDIVEASSGEEAINILKKPNDIDLVILDVNLPGA
jgi:CheY-like chemotaxis protein